MCHRAVNECASGLLVTFSHTKTIQSGKRRLHLPLLALPQSPLCPVAAYRRTLLFHSGLRNAPVFQYRTAAGLSDFTRSAFLRHLRVLLHRANIPDFQLFRGHSFRRGGASWAFHSGVSPQLIQIFGDWCSDAYRLYIEFSMASKVSFARQFSAQLL